MRSRAPRLHLVRVAFALGAMALSTVGFTIACNGIIGVEEVRLRRDSGGTDAFEEEPEPEDEAGTPETGPTPGANILEVALGLQHTCARKPEGTVKCWGDDTRSQTGTTGSADGGIVATPTPVAVKDARGIASGQYHTCVVRTSGKVSCWGDNMDGQLGDGKTVRSATPVDAMGITDAIAITCGASFSCALRTGGGVACWGNGLGGQLGNGTKQLQPVPAPVSNLTNAMAISAGESHACAVKGDGKVVCWGDGVNGQLGNGDQLERTMPTAVVSLDGVSLVASGSRSTCALKRTGGVFCWGANELGQLGSGAPNPTPNPTPTVVSGLDAVAVWGGKDHTCAVKRGGTVACWGRGFEGQIGDGQPRAATTTPTANPSAVSGITNAIGVGTGGNHSCAPTTTGTILCWGENSRGEIGKGAPGPALLSPESALGYP